MAFLDTLANIGLTIGKAALSIFSGGRSTVLENGRILTVSEYKINDLIFYTEQKKKRKDVYIQNTSIKKNYMVVLCNTDGKEGDPIYLKANERAPVTDWFGENLPQDTRIQISQTDENSGVRDDGNSRLSVSFNKLQIKGEPVTMGGVRIYAMDNGIKLECRKAMGLQNMEFCMLRNDKGISMIQSEPIPPAAQQDGEETRFYPVEYSRYGLADGDKVSGVVNIAVNDKSVLLENCRQSSSLRDDDVHRILLAKLAGIKIITKELPVGTVGNPYTVTLETTVSPGTDKVEWECKNTLPEGLALNVQTGVLAGNPTESYMATITIWAKDMISGESCYKRFILEIK